MALDYSNRFVKYTDHKTTANMYPFFIYDLMPLLLLPVRDNGLCICKHHKPSIISPNPCFTLSFQL